MAVFGYRAKAHQKRTKRNREKTGGDSAALLCMQRRSHNNRCRPRGLDTTPLYAAAAEQTQEREIACSSKLRTGGGTAFGTARPIAAELNSGKRFAF